VPTDVTDEAALAELARRAVEVRETNSLASVSAALSSTALSTRSRRETDSDFGATGESAYRSSLRTMNVGNVEIFVAWDPIRRRLRPEPASVAVRSGC
jgi:hypothetical protein